MQRRKLGFNQELFLDLLVGFGPWYRGCWWAKWADTERVGDSLWKRGLVRRTEEQGDDGHVRVIYEAIPEEFTAYKKWLVQTGWASPRAVRLTRDAESRDTIVVQPAANTDALQMAVVPPASPMPVRLPRRVK